MSASRVNCYKCKHLKITWQPSFPYACAALGFKSKRIPSFEVFKNSGIHCQLFAAKTEKEGK